eukprot:6178172-Pleurochrysis_carterae.AAC.4
MSVSCCCMTQSLISNLTEGSQYPRGVPQAVALSHFTAFLPSVRPYSSAYTSLISFFALNHSTHAAL